MKHNQQSTKCHKYPIDDSSIRIMYGKYELMGFMNPHDFLSLATAINFNDEEKNTANHLTSTEWQKQQIKHKQPLDVTYLSIKSHENIGEINGHEGRHRAKASIDLGIDEIPVILRIPSYVPFKDKHGYIDYDHINRLLDKTKSADQLVQDIGNAQKSITELPSFCTLHDNEITCTLQPEISDTDFLNHVTKPAKKIKIRISDFKPQCKE
jgi:hypothetical protein